MKKSFNIFLIIAIILPVILLFYPFATWNDVMSLVLRVIPSIAAQVLLCRIGQQNIIKAIPALFTGAFAVWGVYLYYTSPHWTNATFLGLIADYISPFICSVGVFIVYALTKKIKYGN